MHRPISRRALLRAGAVTTVAAAALITLPGAGALAQTPTPPTATPQAKPGKRSQKQRVFDRLMIAEVVAGSPAEKAGLKAGEAISMIDGKSVAEQKDLAGIVAAKKPGDTLSLEVIAADGAKRTVSVILGDNPSKAGTAYLGIRYGGHGMRGRGGRGGFDTGPVTVAEVQADSPAGKAGVQVGDVITEANGAAITGLMSLKRVLAGAKPGDTLTLKVTRGSASQTLSVTLGENPTQKGTAYLGLSVSLPRIQIDPGPSTNGTSG